MSAPRKAAARAIAAQYIAATRALEKRPRLYVRINALDTPHWEEDLAGVMGSRPDGVLLPKARSGGDVHTLSIALNHAEERAGAEKGATRIIALATEVPISLLQMHTYVGSSSRLEGLTWGRGGPVRCRRRAHQSRGGRQRWTSPYQLARNLCLFTAAAAIGAADRHRVRQLPRRRGPARRGDGGGARRLHRQDGHPPQPGGGHQRGVHADGGADRGLRGDRAGLSPTTRKPACSASAGKWWIAPTSPVPSASWRVPGPLGRGEIAVIPGLVPGIHLSARSGICGWLDPGDEHRDDAWGV